MQMDAVTSLWQWKFLYISFAFVVFWLNLTCKFSKSNENLFPTACTAFTFIHRSNVTLAGSVVVFSFSFIFKIKLQYTAQTHTRTQTQMPCKYINVYAQRDAACSYLFNLHKCTIKAKNVSEKWQVCAFPFPSSSLLSLAPSIIVRQKGSDSGRLRVVMRTCITINPRVANYNFWHHLQKVSILTEINTLHFESHARTQTPTPTYNAKHT